MLNRLTLSEMAAGVRAGRFSAAELVEAHLRRIEEVNPELNAFVSVFAEEARAAAKDIRPGPLAGVPVTIKDSFDIAGSPTYCGSTLRIDHRASRDAASVARLRAAGAIVLGKTNCPEFLCNYETDNRVSGRTNSPWNRERTPGGSSGGEGAAIASFCSPGGMGSDGGGSIREPAHFSGIAGLKPTPGRVPATGHFPLIAHPGGLLGVGGPMARTAADVKLLFEIVAGHDDQDPFSAPVPLRTANLDGLRIGVMPRFGEVPVEAAIRAAVEKAGRAAEQLGIPVEPFQPRGLGRAHDLWWFFFGQVPAPFLRQLTAGRDYGIELMEIAYDQPAPTAQTLIENLGARDAMRAALLRQMRDYPVLLCPPCSIPAFRHGERSWKVDGRRISLLDAMSQLTWVNLLGLPAMVIPFDMTADGLPIGVQIVGRPYEEEVLLEVAMQLEQVRGPFPAPPL